MVRTFQRLYGKCSFSVVVAMKILTKELKPSSPFEISSALAKRSFTEFGLMEKSLNFAAKELFSPPPTLNFQLLLVSKTCMTPMLRPKELGLS